MLSATDLDGPVEREGRARGSCADSVLRPVRTLDETHVAREGEHATVARDPQQTARRVADGDHDPRFGSLARQQQTAHHFDDLGERMCTAMGFKLVRREV